MRILVLLALMAIPGVQAFAADSIPGAAVHLDPADVVPVKLALTSKIVYEIQEMNRAIIVAPKFVFDRDVGYGLELLPDGYFRSTEDYSYVLDFICWKHGYAKLLGTRGVRKGGRYVMGHAGDPRRSGAPGLNISEVEPKEVIEDVICRMK
jgi:hypothetical protein